MNVLQFSLGEGAGCPEPNCWKRNTRILQKADNARLEPLEAALRESIPKPHTDEPPRIGNTARVRSRKFCRFSKQKNAFDTYIRRKLPPNLPLQSTQ